MHFISKLKNSVNSVKNGWSAHAYVFDLTFPILGLTLIAVYCSFAQLI